MTSHFVVFVRLELATSNEKRYDDRFCYWTGFYYVTGPWIFTLKIETVHHRSVTTSWFQIWQEYAALQAMCGHRGLSGFSVINEWLVVEFGVRSRGLRGSANLPSTNEMTIEAATSKKALPGAERENV